MCSECHVLKGCGIALQVDRIDDQNDKEATDSDASTSASEEEAEGGDNQAALRRRRRVSAKAKAAALDILQGKPALPWTPLICLQKDLHYAIQVFNTHIHS